MTFLYLMGLLALIVFIHEGGHYSAARWLGYPVAKFQIGMGPPLLHYTNASGTQFGFSPLLVGGFIKIEKTIQDSMPPKHWFMVVLAGPGFNIMAWLVLMPLLPLVLGGTIEQHVSHQFNAGLSLLGGLGEILLKPISLTYWTNMFQSGNLLRVVDAVPNLAAQREVSELQLLFSFFVFANFGIAAFNLLPILPLDGGHLVRSLLKIILPSKVVLVEKASFYLAGFGIVYFGLWMLGTLLADIWVIAVRLIA